MPCLLILFLKRLFAIFKCMEFYLLVMGVLPKFPDMASILSNFNSLPDSILQRDSGHICLHASGHWLGAPM